MAINRVYFQNCCGTKMETLWSLFPPYRPLWGHGGGAAEVELYAGRRIIYVARRVVPWNGHKICARVLKKFSSKESVTFMNKSFIPIVCHRA